MKYSFNTLKVYTDFIKGIVGFLAIGVMLMIFIPWQGEYFKDCSTCATKEQYLKAVFIVYSMLVGFVTAFIVIVFILNYFLNFIFQYLPFLQPQQTVSDYIQGILLFTLSAVIAHGILSLFVYTH